MSDDLAPIRSRITEGYTSSFGDYPGAYQAVHDVAVLLGIVDALRSRLSRIES